MFMESFPRSILNQAIVYEGKPMRTVRPIQACFLALLACALLVSCSLFEPQHIKDYPLKDGAIPLAELLDDAEAAAAIERALAARKPNEIENADPDDAVAATFEGAPNALTQGGLFAVLGDDPWEYGHKLIDGGSDWRVAYELRTAPAGYVRTYARISGYDEDGHTTRLEFDIGVRLTDYAIVYATLGSITANCALER